VRPWGVGRPREGETVNVKVDDLMSRKVVTIQPHKTIAHARALMDRNDLSSVPVVDSDLQPVGIVSATDLLPDLKAGAPVSTIMTKKVYTVPQYGYTCTAATPTAARGCIRRYASRAMEQERTGLRG